MGQGPDVVPGANRPRDLALRQQRLKAWKPILDPKWVIAALLIIAAIFIPVGKSVCARRYRYRHPRSFLLPPFVLTSHLPPIPLHSRVAFKLNAMSDDIVELRQQYDAYDDPAPLCGINTTANAGRRCTLELTVPRDMDPPVLVHYEISGFYQNQRRYVTSRDDAQLLGATTQTQLALDNCRPLATLSNETTTVTLNPCGLVANTLFNDVFALSTDPDMAAADADGVPLAMLEEGIAWQSDLEFKFRQPDGFRQEQCGSCGDANCTCAAEDWSCTDPYQDQDGNCFLYYYPNDDTTQYLYETYPMVVSPLDGVLNEHFIVWMRTAALPTFRKLYGWFDQPIAAGTKLTFEVEANWEVASFRGLKALVVSNNNAFGGKNEALGRHFLIVGVMCLGFAAFFWLKHTFRRRNLADQNYLHFKEE